MMLELFSIIFSSFLSLTIASHFLGGSFTYRHIPRPVDKQSKAVLVELRFHISDHYFICTPEQVNEHFIVYLLGEIAPYDEFTGTLDWNRADAVLRNKKYYDIFCATSGDSKSCDEFQEKVWAYCESTNQISGYSILRRQFLLIVERYKPIQLIYSECCWANSSNKPFFFNLSIETYKSRVNSSPYPHIPASYYVDIKDPAPI